MRVNPFSFILFLIHKVAFCWTPIHAERYLAQFEEDSKAKKVPPKQRQRKSRNGIQLVLDGRDTSTTKNNDAFSNAIRVDNHRGDPEQHDDGDDDEGEGDYLYDRYDDADDDEGNFAHQRKIDREALPWRYFLLHPMQLIRAIKRYHMVGNYFLIGILVHFTLLFHLLIKSIVMVFVERPSLMAAGRGPEKRATAPSEYYGSPYYPYITGSFSEPYSTNNMALTMLIFCICSRLLSASRLARNAIINQKRYRRIWVSQMNMVTISLMKLTPAEWMTLFTEANKHRRALRCAITMGEEANTNDMLHLRRHLQLNAIIRAKLNKCSMRELMYRCNAIEFEQCFSGLKFQLTRHERSETYRQWFLAKFHHRSCICTLQAGILLSLVGTSIILGLSCLFFVSVLYLEIRSTMSPDQLATEWSVIAMQLFGQLHSNGILHLASGWWTCLREHFSHPTHLIRSVELYMFLLLNVPNHIDAIMVYTDFANIFSRIQKITALFEYEAMLSDPSAGGDYLNLIEPSSSFDEEKQHFESWSLAANRVGAAASINELPATRGSHKSKSSYVTQLVNFQMMDSHRQQVALARSTFEWNEIEEEKANVRMLHLIKLSNCLYREFTDLRSMHSLYFNLVFVGNGICISYILTLMALIKDPVQLLLLSIALISCLVPTLIILLMCAILERRLKNLYIKMVQLMSNGPKFRTLYRLRVVSRLLEKKEGRAMLMFGKYAITQDSMTSASSFTDASIIHQTSPDHRVYGYSHTLPTVEDPVFPPKVGSFY